jgi:hypothetical protein
VINRDTGEATVVGPFGTHKGYLFSSDEGKGFFFVLEPNMGASVSTMICGPSGCLGLVSLRSHFAVRFKNYARGEARWK